jgi:CheY-like chemotaxis protein
MNALSMNQTRRPLRILIIDDEPLILRALSRALGAYQVTTAEGGEDALRQIEQNGVYDLILCDLMMPAPDGIDLYFVLKERQPTWADRVVFMTGGTFTSRASEFLESVTNATLHKPFDMTEIRSLVERWDRVGD